MNASRQSFVVSAAICVLLAGLFILRWRFAPYPAEAPFEGGMPLAAALVRFTAANPWWVAALAATVVIWTLLAVVQLSVKYVVPANRSFLPAQIFLIGAGGLALAGELLAALISAWLLALAARQFVFSLRKGYRFSEVFHAGFFLGSIPLLYAPAAAAVPAIALSALAIYRRSGREAVVCFAGMALPVPAAGFIHWAAGTDGGFIYREIWRCAFETRPMIGSMPYYLFVPAALVLILVLTAVIWMAGHKKNVRKTQYKFVVQTALTLLLLAASALLGGTSTALLSITAVPCAMIVPYAFAGKTAAVSTVVYCLIMAAVLALALLPFSGFPVL